MTPRRWDRHLWGITFTTLRDTDNVILIGSSWLDAEQVCGDGPSRAALFVTRREARDAAKGLDLKYAYLDGWRFRAVRVRETVRVG